MDTVLEQGYHTLLNCNITQVLNEAPFYDLHFHGTVAYEQLIKSHPALVTYIIAFFAPFWLVKYQVIGIWHVEPFIIILAIKIFYVAKLNIIRVIRLFAFGAREPW